MSSADRIPDKLGPYRLRERIGEGGMGAVYLSRDRERRMVAVKVLHSRVAAEPTARRRLAREVEAMRRVRSPFVAEVLDADVTGKFPYIVTRYVPGQTLDHVVRQQGPLAPRALERLASGLAQALVAVHAAGIVHRDLKPGNVMLHDGDPVVIDFGIAHTGDSTRLTQTGMFMGTPGYLAPEVIEGQPSSEASDVHSWGATIAYAATGRPPFGSGSFENVFYRIVQGNADINGIPGPLAQFVSAALSRDPRRRPTAAWLSAQCTSPGLAAGPPMLNGASQGATPAYGNGLAYGAGAAAAGAAAYGAAEMYRGGATGGLNGAGHGAGVNGVNGAGVNGAVVNGAGVNGAAAYGAGGGAIPYAAQGAQAGGLSPRGLNAGGAYPAAPEQARALPQPIRPGEYADLLPPVQYAPASGGTQVRAAPGMAAPYGTAPGAGYPAAPSQGGTAAGRPAEPRAADTAHRASPPPLLGLAAMVIAVAVSVLLPVAGLVSALAVITLLRAADRSQSALTVRRSARGASASDVLVGVLTAPWAIARSLLTMVLLAPVAALVAAVVFVATMITVSTNAVPLAGAYAAGAAVAFYGIGPGSGGPRRQVSRIFRAVARTRASAAVAALVMFCLAAAAVATALSQPPLYWPMISGLLPHLPSNLNGLMHALHLPHVSVPHFGVGRSRLG